MNKIENVVKRLNKKLKKKYDSNEFKEHFERIYFQLEEYDDEGNGEIEIGISFNGNGLYSDSHTISSPEEGETEEDALEKYISEFFNDYIKFIQGLKL